MDTFLHFLDWLYFDGLVPLFSWIARACTLITIEPMNRLHLPAGVQVIVIAVVTGIFSLTLRQWLRVDEKVRRFQELFAEKRRRQQDLQLIPDKYSRAALYELTDEELNSDFNTYLAHHYARYVTIYMLPLFLVLAWLNRVVMPASRGGETIAYVVHFPTPLCGIGGLTVTGLFLLAYLLTLVAGFRLIRHRRPAPSSGGHE